MIMVGHAYYPELQGGEPQPATLSRTIVTDLLRTRMGYDGVILTDDLEMGAVDQRLSPGEVALRALEAGNDLVMYCKSWDRVEEAHEAIVRSLDGDPRNRSRIDESLSRVFLLKERLPSLEKAPEFSLARFAGVCESLARLEGDARG